MKTLLTDVPEDLTGPLFPEADVEQAGEPAARATQAMEAATGRDGWETGETESEDGFHRVSVRNGEVDTDVSTDVYLRGEEGELSVAAIGEDITSVEAPGFPEGLVRPAFAPSPETARFGSVEPVYDGSGMEPDERGVGEAVSEVRDYPGVAGFYALDLGSGSGYGVRPDEEFFSASTIKVAVMAAVYKRIEEGRLEYSDSFTTEEEDWAAGAGGLQWETPGVETTVEDALWLMMTRSDNVATNALTRLVGGPEYVEKVARDLGARDTHLFWKVTSERGAVPGLDNRTTPRDMATMLRSIYEGDETSDYGRGEMIGLMEQNNLEFWMEAGVPEGTRVANKGGWLDATYNDVGIVEYEDKPYVLATFTKYGQGMDEGGKALAGISEAVWLAQTGKTKDEYERESREAEEQPDEEQPEEVKDAPESPTRPSGG